MQHYPAVEAELKTLKLSVSFIVFGEKVTLRFFQFAANEFVMYDGDDDLNRYVSKVFGPLTSVEEILGALDVNGYKSDIKIFDTKGE